MIQQYRKRITEEYFKRLKDGTLSSNSTDLTPNTIKAECIIIYNLRGTGNDSFVLREVFGLPDEKGNFGNAMTKPFGGHMAE